MRTKPFNDRKYVPGSGRRVFSLVKHAIESLGGPVCFGDLFDFALLSPDFAGLTLKKIKRHVKAHVESGAVVNLGSFKETSRGRFLYALPGTDTRNVESRTLVRPHEIVLAAFKEIWNKHLTEAFDEGRRPKPVLTRDVYQYLQLLGHTFDDKRTLPNTLLRLAQLKNAPIRKLIRVGETFSAWVPSAIKDVEVYLAESYASDSERIVAAVTRAYTRLGRPVSKKDVLEEISFDPSLELQSLGSLSVQLLGCAKDKGYVNGKLVHRDSRVAVRKAGQVQGKAYYFLGTKADRPQNAGYVEFCNLRRRWNQMAAHVQLDQIEGCPLPTVAIGRALLVLSDARHLEKELKAVLKTPNIGQGTIWDAESLAREVADVISLSKEWISNKNIEKFNLPSDVNTLVPGLISDELLPLVAPFYPILQEAQDSNRLVALMDGAIRRIRNPSFISRFCKSPREAAQYLFDRADALVMIAKEWGGPECTLQANLAIELGDLRDARFVIPALESNSFDVRFSAVACLAFLQDSKGNEKLRECLLNDLDPNIRLSAVWAYAFTQPADLKQVLRQVCKTDANSNVRNFAETIIGLSYEDLWRV